MEIFNFEGIIVCDDCWQLVKKEAAKVKIEYKEIKSIAREKMLCMECYEKYEAEKRAERARVRTAKAAQEEDY